MFPFDQLGNAAKALVNEAKEVGTAIVNTVRDGVEWGRDVIQGNVGTQAQVVAPIPEVVQRMAEGKPDSWTANAKQALYASHSHAEISNNLMSMLNNLEPAWNGNAAEAARGNTKQFTDVMDSARKAFDDNSQNVSASADGFVLAKNSFKPMGPPPDKGFFDVITPWKTDTEAAIERYNEAGRHNVDVYDRYATQLDSYGSGLRAEYGDFPYQDSGASPVDDTTPVRGFGGRSDSGDDSPARSGGHPVTPMVGGSPPPGSAAGPGAHPGSGPVNGPGSVNVPAASGGHVGDGTTAAGYTPLDPRTNQSLPNFPTPNLPGPGGGSGPTTGGVNLVSGPGAVGGLGGVGKPGEIGGTPGGGRQTGARGLIDEPGRGGAGTGRGAGGRATGGPAGMAPGMGRGAKEEDKERQRKYIRDEDTLFTDEDKKTVDPTTGLPPVPPTIGA